MAQGWGAAESSWHWNVTLVASVAANSKCAVATPLGSDGFEVIERTGGAVSTVQGNEATSLAPSVLTAFTWKVCDPSARAEYDCGLEHNEKPSPSSWHWKVAIVSGGSMWNVKLAVLWLDGFEGPESMTGWGGAAAVAGRVSGTATRPAASVAAKRRTQLTGRQQPDGARRTP